LLNTLTVYRAQSAHVTWSESNLTQESDSAEVVSLARAINFDLVTMSVSFQSRKVQANKGRPNPNHTGKGETPKKVWCMCRKKP
jgi:hypothetical protein